MWDQREPASVGARGGDEDRAIDGGGCVSDSGRDDGGAGRKHVGKEWARDRLREGGDGAAVGDGGIRGGDRMLQEGGSRVPARRGGASAVPAGGGEGEREEAVKHLPAGREERRLCGSDQTFLCQDLHECSGGVRGYEAATRRHPDHAGACSRAGGAGGRGEHGGVGGGAGRQAADGEQGDERLQLRLRVPVAREQRLRGRAVGVSDHRREEEQAAADDEAAANDGDQGASSCSSSSSLPRAAIQPVGKGEEEEGLFQADKDEDAQRRSQQGTIAGHTACAWRTSVQRMGGVQAHATLYLQQPLTSSELRRAA
mmetsp:Transcript_49872/g.156082  ORF Transcript_49872/g.156082 Transcript_49872/m.156082 type:complete len:313 (-) Transcript_49872:123-1061(-)